jgi:hypothetical protein
MPLDLSSRSFIPLPRFIRSRRPTPFLPLPSSFFLRVLSKRHILGVYFNSLSGWMCHCLRGVRVDVSPFGG